MIDIVRGAAFAALAFAAGAASAFELASADVGPGERLSGASVFKGFGCDGENLSPALAWKDAPKGTKSFALLVHDPDAPTGGAGWWHWVVYDLPAGTRSLDRGAGTADGAKLPKGTMQAKTDFGTPGWGGPCPPVGDKPHRYVFSLHALKVERLEVPEGASASLVGFLVNANSLGKATLTAKYGRSK